MHVCYLTHEYPLPGSTHGGVGVFVRTLGQKLTEQGIRVSVVGAGYGKDDYVNDNGVHVYAIKDSTWKLGRFIDNSRRINRMLRKIHAERPINIVETPEIGLAFIRKKQSTRYVIRMHGGHHFFTVAERRPREIWKVIQEKRSFLKADSITAVSHFVANATRRMLHLQEEPSVIYNPVDLGRFPGFDEAKVIPNEVLFIGTVCEKKGIRQLIQSIEFIRKEVPQVRLRIVGRDWKFPKTGASYTAFLQRTIPSDILAHVLFSGPLPNHEIPGIIETAEVCAFPSHMEAMPIAWIEALAMGKAVVGSREGPGPEAIVDGRTGLLADPHDPADIAEKITYLLQHKEEAGRMGTRAREDILQRFNVEQCVFENIAFYEQVLAD
jgi:glycosyltransferase involved in cell wall biosynthesis